MHLLDHRHPSLKLCCFTKRSGDRSIYGDWRVEESNRFLLLSMIEYMLVEDNLQTISFNDIAWAGRDIPDNKKGEKYFRKVIKELLVGEGGKKMKSDMSNIDNIIKNIKISYESPNDRTTNTRCKLMGLDFFYSMMELGPEKMREFGTDMVYIAQKKRTKKNDKFGPFGKVY